VINLESNDKTANYSLKLNAASGDVQSTSSTAAERQRPRWSASALSFSGDDWRGSRHAHSQRMVWAFKTASLGLFSSTQHLSILFISGFESISDFTDLVDGGDNKI